MHSARCTIDGRTYNAEDFSLLPASELNEKRKELICLRCGAPAYFKSAARNGRQSACFGSKSHGDDCRADDVDDGGGEADSNGCIRKIGKHIVLNLNDNVSKKRKDPIGGDGGGSNLKTRRARGYANSGNEVSICKPVSVLKMLIKGEKISSFNIEGREYEPEEFFVPFLQVKESDVGQLRGFWGLIESVDVTGKVSGFGDCSAWLNSRGKYGFGVFLLKKDIRSLCEYLKINDVNILKGCYMLIITTNLRKRRKIFAMIDGMLTVAVCDAS